MYQRQKLQYDSTKWLELDSKPVNTLQMFITNRCNMRCPECFNLKNLGREQMTFEQYKTIVLNYTEFIEKVILVGGEPTLYKQLPEIIRFNRSLNKRTTIYTNGANLRILKDVATDGLSVRISVFGLDDGWKALRKLRPYDYLSTMFTYMLKKDNVNEFLQTACVLEKEYGCTDLLISSCRGEDYWTEYENTLPLSEYPQVINQFINEYDGAMTLHIATRGVLEGKNSTNTIEYCRYANIFIDKLIMCPFDIAQNHTTDKIEFGKTKCVKHDSCLLTKVVLKKIQ